MSNNDDIPVFCTGEEPLMTDDRPVAEQVREALTTFDAAALRPTYPPRHHRYEGRPDALLHVHLPAFALRWLRALLAERDALADHVHQLQLDADERILAGRVMAARHAQTCAKIGRAHV